MGLQDSHQAKQRLYLYIIFVLDQLNFITFFFPFIQYFAFLWPYWPSYYIKMNEMYISGRFEHFSPFAKEISNTNIVNRPLFFGFFFFYDQLDLFYIHKQGPVKLRTLTKQNEKTFTHTPTS